MCLHAFQGVAENHLSALLVFVFVYVTKCKINIMVTHLNSVGYGFAQDVVLIEKMHNRIKPFLLPKLCGVVRTYAGIHPHFFLYKTVKFTHVKHCLKPLKCLFFFLKQYQRHLSDEYDVIST